MINLAPWFYKNLINENEIISSIVSSKCQIFNIGEQFEALAELSKKLKPTWIPESNIYSNCDGSGTSKFSNVAIHKAISEALERWAFYETIDTKSSMFLFDENPSTTGMAAFPGITHGQARKNAIFEASERWALHEFWRGNLPILEHSSAIANLSHYEIVTDLKDVKISLLCLRKENQFLYSFAADSSLAESLKHSLVELSRNVRVMGKYQDTNVSYKDFTDITDRRLFFFSTLEGNQLFNEKILSAPSCLKVKPNLICDLEVRGPWTKYAKVWRYLYANSCPSDESDHTFFMF